MTLTWVLFLYPPPPDPDPPQGGGVPKGAFFVQGKLAAWVRLDPFPPSLSKHLTFSPLFFPRGSRPNVFGFENVIVVIMTDRGAVMGAPQGPPGIPRHPLG